MRKGLQGKTILIIEDEAEIRNFASRVLELEGYRVLGAETGEEGLELARRSGINLVLLDLRLPIRDGWSVLTQMKRESELSAIPVIILTASAAVPRRVRALSMGADNYLVKPLSAASLKRAVAGALRRKEGRYSVAKENISTGS